MKRSGCRSQLAHLILTFSTAYCLNIGIWHLLLITPLRRVWWVQLINIFDLWLYLPLPFLVVRAFRQRAPSRWLVLLPLLLFLWSYSAFFLPNFTNGPRPVVRVMTWNIGYTNTDIQAIRRHISQEQPDVIVLQELGLALAADLENTLHETYPYQHLYPSPSVNGFGILSRYPIAKSIPPS